MATGYADRLTKGYDYGECGLPERMDNSRRKELGINKLVELLRSCKYLVAHTGAGISTSTGIPDFRGPNGVWTKEKARERPKSQANPVTTSDQSAQVSKSMDKEPDTPWESVVPSLTHRALTELHRVGILKFIVTQNVDSLHLRSGYPRECVAELHGNVFKEVCSKCQSESFQPFDVAGIGFRPTGRQCQYCGGMMRDELLDWEDALPETDLEISQDHCKMADVSICLGTSLRVQKGGSLVIINKQATPLDYACTIRIFADIDEVMKSVIDRLGYSIPPYDPTHDFVHSKRVLTFPNRYLLRPPPTLLRSSRTLLQETDARKNSSIKRKEDEAVSGVPTKRPRT